MQSTRLPSRRAHGFTLIELMVALVLSSLLAIGLIKVQASLGQQNVRGSDIGVRDTQARAAMDLITADLSGAGFLFGGTQNFCNALLTYNAGVAGYFVHHPVDSVAATSGTQMMFAPSLTLNYPPSTSTVSSDVLIVSATTASTNFNDSVYPIAMVAPNSAYTPMTTGILAVASTMNAATSGDIGILQAPVSGKRACMRVPIASSGLVVTSAGTLMPANYYTGFSAQLAGAGYTDVLSNAEIFQGRMVDLGPTSAPLQTSVAYYVDGSGSFPVLMRASYSLLDDTLVGTPQSIAAGVVALKVLFGIDPGNTGAVTDYKNAAYVTANKYWDSVRTVQVAIVTRTINDDPNSTFSDPNCLPVGSSPCTLALGTPFGAMTLPGNDHRHYTVQRTEIASRNLLWK